MVIMVLVTVGVGFYCKEWVWNSRAKLHYSRGVRGDSSVSLQGLDFRHPMVLGLIAMNMYLVVQGVASHCSISTV